MKKYSILLIALVVCTVFITKAQTKNSNEKKSVAAKLSLSGKIIDAQNGLALAGATIYIHEAKVITISKDDGSYTTSTFPAGSYLVEISFIGYSTIIETININGNYIKNFTMVPSVADHEAVTVTGVASATRIKQSAQAVSIVKKIDLLQTTSTNIIDALSKRVPGLTSLSSGPAIAKPIIRGLGYNRVVVVNDGVRQEGQQWGDEHGIEIDENSVQKAEVIKGPASLMYGSDAMAGVVNLLTNIPVEQNTIRGNLGYQLIDNNGLHATNGNLAGHTKNGFNFNFFGTYKSAKDYTNKYDGKVFNSRYNERNFGGYLGINKAWGYSHLLISNFNQNVGLVEGDRDDVTGKFLIYSGTINEREATEDELNSRVVNTPYQKINHFKIALDNNIAMGNGRLTTNIGYQQNKRKEYGDPDNYTTPSLHFDLQTTTYNFQYHLQEKNGFKTSIGVNGMYQQSRNKAEEVLIPEYNQLDAGVFVFTKKSFEKYTLSGGLRGDIRNVKGMQLLEGINVKFAGFNKQFSNFSGSVGMAYNVTKDITLKANIARGYRAPAVAELASNGKHEGTDRYEFGDTNLKTETSLQLDGGIDLNSEHFTLLINAFYNNINNYIYYGKLEAVGGGDSLVITPDGPATAFKFRQANASLSGFELKFDIHPHPLDWLHFENSFSFVAGTFNQSFEGTNRLPFMPAPRWQSELKADIKKIGNTLKNAYIKLEMDNVSKQNNVFFAYNTETPTRGYTLFNIGLGTDIGSKNKKLCSVYMAFNNITDVTFQSHLSRLKYTAENNATGRQGVFNMGKNFSLKVQVPLSFKLK